MNALTHDTGPRISPGPRDVPARSASSIIRCTRCHSIVGTKSRKFEAARKLAPVCTACRATAARERRSRIASLMVGTGRRPKEAAAAMGMCEKTFEFHWLLTRDAIRKSSDSWEQSPVLHSAARRRTHHHHAS